MEPQIRYCTTSDGVSIAYYAIGSGPPLIVVPAGLHQSIGFAWQVSSWRASAEAAQAWTYVRYDPRGSGLSERDVTGFSLEDMARDIEAVADALGAGEFRLFAAGRLGMAGAAFAARAPERVSHLVLWSSALHGSDFDSASLNALRDMAATDWRIASESITQAVDQWDHPDLARQHAEVMRASVEPAAYLAFMHSAEQWDLAALAPAITCPTLVISPAANTYRPVAGARRLAAAIPHARLALTQTRSVLMPDAEVVRLASRFFLGLEDQTPTARRPKESPAEGAGTMAVILFADIADSTALTERFGDAAFRARARELDAALRAAVRDHGGAVIDAKTLGDGILATFPAAAQAIEGALACGGAGNRAGLPLHLGLHAGDVIREADNVYGGAVNIAARISALAAAGEVLVSDIVRGLARTSAGVTFEDRGEQALKGVAEAVRVYAVRPGAAP